MKHSTKRADIANEKFKEIFALERERCINCRMLDASQLCSLKLINLPDADDMRKAHISDPQNEVCNNFESRKGNYNNLNEIS